MSTDNQERNPEYGSHCAFAVSTGKMDVEGGKYSLIKDGRLYVFSNPVAKFLFKVLPGRIEKADKNWDEK